MKKIEKLTSEAATIGYAVQGAFRRAVTLFTDARAAVPAAIRNDYDAMSKCADMLALVAEYQAGYVARSLQDSPVYRKKWGNYGPEQCIAEGRAILALPSAKGDKPDRRTDEQEAAVRAAQKSCSLVRDAAGFPKRGGGGRKPRPSANDKGDTTPKADGETVTVNTAPNFTVATPKVADGEAANTHLATALASLLAFVDINADHVAKPWSELINAAYATARKAKLIPSAE